MTETINNEQIQELSKELQELSNNQTLNFINDSIFDFTKSNTNDIVLKTKEKIIKKKYKLYQYNLNVENFIYINNFVTFSDISKYLENLNIHINLKTLLKNKLFKIELII
jgi:hypothetical protein